MNQINAELLAPGILLTYVDHDDEHHTFVVKEVDMDPEYRVLGDRITSWEILDRDDNVWMVFVALNFGGTPERIIQSISPITSSSRYDVVDLRMSSVDPVPLG